MPFAYATDSLFTEPQFFAICLMGKKEASGFGWKIYDEKSGNGEGKGWQKIAKSEWITSKMTLAEELAFNGWPRPN